MREKRKALTGIFTFLFLIALLFSTTGIAYSAELKIASQYNSFISIQRGDSGEDVKEVQSLLAALGYLSSFPDGDFGPKTEQAVIDFQKAAGIQATGIVDEKTYAYLNSGNAPKKAVETQQLYSGGTDSNTSQVGTDTRSTNSQMVWIPIHGGQKFHSKSSCSGMIDPQQVTRSQAESLGFTPCKKCKP